jgi:hypothetical protein
VIECRHCGAANKPDSRYCGECGQPMATSQPITCPLCDTTNPAGIMICIECGAGLLPPGVSPSEIARSPGEADEEGMAPEGPRDERRSDEEPARQESPPAEQEPEDEGQDKQPAPPWLRKLKAAGSETPEEVGGEADVPVGELPEWLEVPPEYQEMLGRTSAGEDEGGAQPGDTPPWMEQLRPEVEEAPGEEQKEDADQGEPAGVLKGIRDTLGIEPIVAIPHRAMPSTPAVSSSTAEERGELFASVAREPAYPGVELAGTRRVETLATSGMRWISYLILFAAVTVPLLLGSTWSVRNLPPTDAASAMYQTIESLPPGAVVLLSHDYDPGEAGEMIPQARAVLNHLMMRRLRLINVSLTPEGSRLSEQLLGEVGDLYGYRPGEDYLSLGYVMGVEAGPRSVIDGLLAAHGGALANDVEDISLVVEFAGTPGYLRLWLEQVQGPYGLPMVAGVSGSADPFARPYFRNEFRQQLSGLITGFVGAAQYERLSGQEGLAVAGMDAQSLAHVAIVILIVVGNVAYFSQRMSARLGQ